MTTLRYVFGVRLPHEGRDSSVEQMRLAWKYRNDLVSVELARRAAADKTLREHSPELVSLEAALADADAKIEAAIKDIAAKNAKARARTGTPEQRAAIKEMRVERKALYARRKALRAELFAPGSPLRAALDSQSEHAYAEVRRLRAACGVYWGTYLTIEAACKSFRAGAPPRYRRWNGGGRVAVQIQGGMSADEAMSGTDTRLRLTPIPGARGRHPTHMLSLRIGSTPTGGPTWLHARCKIHRPLPDGARIMWAELQRLVIGPRDEWRLHLVISFESPERIGTPAGSVAVDLGWRMLPDGLRVASWLGSDSRAGTLMIPVHELRRWGIGADLRSIRDMHFEPARDRLAEYLGTITSMPEWFAAATKAIGQWRSSPRLRDVTERWQRAIAAGESGLPPIPDWLMEWRAKEWHLHAWESAAAVKAVRWRDDLYRCFAKRLSGEYATCILENCNWREVVRKPGSEAAESEEATRHHWRIASPGRLATLLGERMVVRRVDAKHTTRKCHACGSMAEWNQAENVCHTCAACGAKWDQDANAAANMLASAEVVMAGTGNARGPDYE